MKVSYIGTKEPGCGPQTVVRHETGGCDLPLDPSRSQKVYNHAPDGFQWGYVGSGPAQLALAILLDVTDDEELSVRLHQDFKRDKVATLGDSFVLTRDEIDAWLTEKKREEIRESGSMKTPVGQVNGDDPLFEQFGEEFRNLLFSPRRIIFYLTKLQAWALLSQLQLALRHPDNKGATAEIAKYFAKKLESEVAVTPALAEVAKRGWDPKYDI